MPIKIIGLGGSLRQASYSNAALRAALGIAHSAGAATELLDLRELDLPLYHPEWSVDDYPAASRPAVRRLAQSYRSADVMLWASPTYHGSMSGALKNAIDFMELLANDSPPYFQGRAIGLVALSDSSPLAGMANCVNELRAWLAPTRLTLGADDFSADLALASPVALRRLARLVEELIQFKAPRL